MKVALALLISRFDVGLWRGSELASASAPTLPPHLSWTFWKWNGPCGLAAFCLSFMGLIWIFQGGRGQFFLTKQKSRLDIIYWSSMDNTHSTRKRSGRSSNCSTAVRNTLLLRHSVDFYDAYHPFEKCRWCRRLPPSVLWQVWNLSRSWSPAPA